jgi:hypothetical protein
MGAMKSTAVTLATWTGMLVAGVGLAGCGGGSTTIGSRDGGASDATLGDSQAVGVGDGGGGGGEGGLSGAFNADGGCLTLGAACASGGECCSGDCVSQSCSVPSCTSDTQPCTSNSQCCGQDCVSGACAPLNAICKTVGNLCTAGAQCCSSYCASNGTCQASSFCGQPGDACSVNANCCTGTCTKTASQTLGTCAATPPGGPANCGLTDGQLCSGSAPDGGVVLGDGGIPACGGPCCSRACAPFGPTGVLVCQPASGCHVVGDLCTRDGDCCGSAGLPGGSGMPVTCVITPPATVGVCRNPMGCKPDGDVCKLKTTTCNSSCDCCSGNCETKDTCKQDNVGVPRCAAAQCVSVGGSCASSANCCNGAPCVPNPVNGGTPPFVCSATQCVAACGACTNNADCCPGSSCIVSAGSTQGMCGPCGGTGGAPDAGLATDGGGAPDGGGVNDSGYGGGDGAAGTCSLYGQICNATADCCDGIPCTGGRCLTLQ